MLKYEYHELSNIFPLMEGEEFERLVEDIKKNGLLEPIVLFEGKILDGRNRYRACLKLEKNPTFKRYPNKLTPLQYVISENIRRRHLNTAQLSEIALELEKIQLTLEKQKREEEYQKALKEEEIKLKKKLEDQNEKIQSKDLTDLSIIKEKVKEPTKPSKEKIRKEVSKDLKVSPISVKKIEKIKEVAKKEPEIAKQLEKARKGEISVNKVHRMAKLVEVKDKIILGKINIDQKQVDVMKNIYYRITQEYRYENLRHYNEITQKECIKYMKMSKNFIQKEVDKFGKRNINS